MNEVAFSKYKKNIFLILLFFLFIFFVGIIAQSTTIIDTFIFIVASRHFKFERILKYIFILRSIMLGCLILFSETGLIPNLVFYRNGIVRYSLGFSYSTFPAHLFLYLTLMYIFLKKGNISLWVSILILVVNGYIFQMTNTKNPFILTIFAIILTRISNKMMFVRNIINKLALISFPLCSFIVVWLSVEYTKFGNNPVLVYINNLVTGRVALSNQAILEYGIHFWGQKIEMVGTPDISNSILKLNYNYIDSSFIQCVVLYGCFFLFLFILGMTLTGIKTINKNPSLSIIFVVMALHGMWDSQLIYLWYNPFLLLMGTLFAEKKEKQLIINKD
ncbi:MAG: hypothetical protein ABF975_02025 [Liquorilactobacillus hordei]